MDEFSLVLHIDSAINHLYPNKYYTTIIVLDNKCVLFLLHAFGKAKNGIHIITFSNI